MFTTGSSQLSKLWSRLIRSIENKFYHVNKRKTCNVSLGFYQETVIKARAITGPYIIYGKCIFVADVILKQIKYQQVAKKVLGDEWEILRVKSC